MDLTDITGRFGNFQKRILFVLLVRPVCWSFVTVYYQFSNRKVDFACESIDGLSDFNDTFQFDGKCERWLNRTGWSDDGHLVNESYAAQCDAFRFDSNKTYTSLTEEWGLVCSREWMISFGYMVFSIGNFVAYIPAGQTADKIGRRPMILIGQATMTVVSVIIAFSSSMPMFLALRFFIGFGFGLVQNPLMASYVESVGPEYRDYIVYSFAAMWGFGAMSVAVVAWLIQEWRTLVLVSSIPFQLPLLLLIYWFVPESTRWLLSNKHYARAEEQIKTQAKMNGKEIKDINAVMDQLKEKIELDQKADHTTFIDLWRNKHLRKVAVILYISFISTVFINHGFALTITLEGGSIYLNLFLAGFAEVPVVFFYYLTVKYFNRRKGLLVSFILTGVIFLAVLPVSDDMLWLKITLAMLGRLTNSLAYTLIYVFANELFPTNLRAVAVSGAMTSGRIGSILCPFADLLGRMYGKYIPILLYGCLSLVTGAVFLLLPETQNKHLPDTVVDFERMTSNTATIDSPTNDIKMVNQEAK